MEAQYPYQDAGLSVHQRVEDLLSRMPLADKVGLMFHTIAVPADVDAVVPLFGERSLRSLVDKGLRHFNVLGSLPDGRSFAQWHNSVQSAALQHPLGIPVTFSSDPRHHFGDNPLTQMMAGPFSLWPEPLGLAAIGSADRVREFADIVRQEYLAVGIRVALHPQLDVATEPRWSRINTTFGEDADLTSRLGVAYVAGLQGPDSGAIRWPRWSSISRAAVPSSTATTRISGGDASRSIPATTPHTTWRPSAPHSMPARRR